ncbi:MAG TPA: hypothetical protein VK986_03365 [Tepidisphaeraceae bacterium]|nr:hypothetical protein [Tepidisphaeraceae bacterium]
MNALKKLFVACAAAVIPASAAWAVNMDGVYVGERKGEPIVITMRGEGRIDGTVQQGSGPAAPLVGEERNGEIRAAFRGPSGNPVQINGRWDGTALRLEAGGEWIVFKKTGAPAAAVAAPAAPVNPLDDAGAPRAHSPNNGRTQS